MAFQFNLVKNKNRARMVAIVINTIALLLAANEFVISIINTGFWLENLASFLFELLLNTALIISLLIKEIEFIEMSLVLLKVYEGTYYPIISAQRLDALMQDEARALTIANHTMFASFSFMLLISLLFFVLFRLTHKNHFWHLMKLVILVGSVLMCVSIAIHIFDIAYSNGWNKWHVILEPISLAVLMVGMFLSCEYVEEETIYA